MLIYLTYNDSPSGIYTSQVIDVVNYLNTLGPQRVKLVALLSIRGFGANKAKIKAACPNATVLPMFPKARYWKVNRWLLYVLFLFKPTQGIVARGPFAAWLALDLRKRKRTKRVVFDARGAYTAELREYEVVQDASVKEAIEALEKEVLEQVDFRIAVSQALVDYWQREFGYRSNRHVVIPCTLSRHFEFEFPAEEKLSALRAEKNYKPDDIIFIYSGSAAGWQSFELVDRKLTALMEADARIRLIVLSKHFSGEYGVMQRFGERVQVLWLPEQEVKNYLLLSDYGILYREDTVTNQVASPVKFAEYLSCGLQVYISERLGDYSSFASEHGLQLQSPAVVSYARKRDIHALSARHFLKQSHKNAYLALISELNESSADN